MVDDGFLIGFEDANGNFVEVGRFNNTADDVTQPLEIKHANSGERITIDSSGLQTQKIDNDRLYAGSFSGSDPDSRLDSCLTRADNGDVVYLESDDYSASRTISKNIVFKGTSSKQIRGSRLLSSWSISSTCVFERLTVETGVTVNINAVDSMWKDCRFDGSSAFQVNEDRFRFINNEFGQVEFATGTSDGLVDSCIGVSVIDNGTNSVGENI
jgi:hypothetical protein